jgi:hypothetical protein
VRGVAGGVERVCDAVAVVDVTEQRQRRLAEFASAFVAAQLASYELAMS